MNVLYYNQKETKNLIQEREDKTMTKAYIVKQDTFDFYYPTRQTGTDIIGYYFDKAEAERVAGEYLKDEYGTVRDAYIEEIEIH